MDGVRVMISHPPPTRSPRADASAAPFSAWRSAMKAAGRVSPRKSICLMGSRFTFTQKRQGG